MYEKVRKLIAEQLNQNEENITPNSRIVEDLGADSLDTIELLMALEDEFGITISDEKASELKTIGDIVAFLETK